MRARGAAALAVVLAVPGCGGSAAPRGVVREAAHADALRPVGQRRAAPQLAEGRWLTARVVRRTALRVRPGGRIVAQLSTRTEFGSPRVLGVTGRRGRWLRVVASERANGRPAWIAAAHARLAATDLSLWVDRSRRALTLRRGDHVLRRVPLAVGRRGSPTPTGRFAITDLLRTSRPDSPYGCCAIALSGHQTKLPPAWPGGDRLAIHATPRPETIGHAASLGCLRAPSHDIRVLMRRLPLGTPVFVQA